MPDTQQANILQNGARSKEGMSCSGGEGPYNLDHVSGIAVEKLTPYCVDATDILKYHFERSVCPPTTAVCSLHVCTETPLLPSL